MSLSHKKQKRIEEFIERLQGASSEEEIKKICDEELDYLKKHYALATVGSDISHYGKAIDKIELADSNSYHSDRTGERRHLARKFFTLSDSEWRSRNDRDESAIDAPQAIDANAIQGKAWQMLDSEDKWELGAALIALTGRRPVEILRLGRLEELGAYKISFKGQAKKRGEKAEFSIFTLAPANKICKAFRRFRRIEDVQQIIKEANQFSDPNAEIDKRCNKPLNRAVSEHFGDFLPPLRDKRAESNKALRAAYAVASQAYHCSAEREGLSKALMFASRALGHFIDREDSEIVTSDLRNLLTTLGYFDYKIMSPIHLISGEKMEDTKRVRVYESDRDFISQMSEEWGLSQPETLARLIKIAQDKMAEPPKELQAKTNNNEGQKMESDRIEKLENQVNEIKEIFAQFMEQKAQQSTTEEKPQNKLADQAERRVRAGIEAIMNFNDFHCSTLEEKWQINSTSLHKLTGSRHYAIKRVLDEIGTAIDDHHIKHGINQTHNRNHHKGENIREEFPSIVQIFESKD